MKASLETRVQTMAKKTDRHAEGSFTVRLDSETRDWLESIQREWQKEHEITPGFSELVKKAIRLSKERGDLGPHKPRKKA